MTITGAPSGPHMLWVSSLEMIAETIEEDICITLNRCSVLCEKNSSLSAEDVKTSSLLKGRGGGQ